MSARRSIQVVTFNQETGERREWWVTPTIFRIIYRALRAYKRAPQYLVDRFDFSR